MRNIACLLLSLMFSGVIISQSHLVQHDSIISTTNSSCADMSPAFSLSVVNDQLVFGSGNNALYFFDLTDSIHPQLVYSLPVPDLAIINTKTHNQYVFAYGDFSMTIYIVDASVPALPVSLGTIPANSQIRDFVVTDDYLYYITWDSLFVVDIADLNQPAVVTQLHLNNARNINYYDNYLYIVSNDGITLFDVTNPLLPNSTQTIAGSYLNTWTDNDNHLLFANYYSSGSGQKVYDISDPSNPVFRFETSNTGTQFLSGKNQQLFRVCYSTIELYEIHNNGLTFLDLDTGKTGYQPTDIETYKNVIYLSKHGGLEVYTIEGNAVTIREAAENNNRCKIYPNPFSSTCTVEFDNPDLTNCKCTISDITGKMVKIYTGSNTGKIEIDRNGLKKGVYFLKLEGTGTIMKKIVVD